MDKIMEANEFQSKEITTLRFITMRIARIVFITCKSAHSKHSVMIPRDTQPYCLPTFYSLNPHTVKLIPGGANT